MKTQHEGYLRFVDEKSADAYRELVKRWSIIEALLWVSMVLNLGAAYVILKLAR